MNYKNYSIALNVGERSSIVAKGSVKAAVINFCMDMNVTAWLVNDKSQIPEYYTEVERFSDVCTVYDDTSAIVDICADKICIYRAGERGLIIFIEGSKRICKLYNDLWIEEPIFD